MNREFRPQGAEESLVKVFLNSDDDYIFINERDPEIFDKFSDFIGWVDEKGKEITKQEEELRQKYKEGIIKYDDDGNVEDINATALCEMSKIRREAYREVAERIDRIFGEDALRKYFKKSYELNPGYVPDDECIFDFMSAMTPVLNEIFSDRRKRIDLKYSQKRKGGNRRKYRSKEEIIQDNMR